MLATDIITTKICSSHDIHDIYEVFHYLYIPVKSVVWICLPRCFCLQRFSISLVGSEPIDKKQMSGVLVSLSPHVASRFSRTASAYIGPIESLMYFLAWGTVLSRHQDLPIIEADVTNFFYIVYMINNIWRPLLYMYINQHNLW